jgi:hypothetical protein
MYNLYGEMFTKAVKDPFKPPRIFSLRVDIEDFKSVSQTMVIENKAQQDIEEEFNNEAAEIIHNLVLRPYQRSGPSTPVVETLEIEDPPSEPLTPVMQTMEPVDHPEEPSTPEMETLESIAAPLAISHSDSLSLSSLPELEMSINNDQLLDATVDLQQEQPPPRRSARIANRRRSGSYLSSSSSSVGR